MELKVLRQEFTANSTIGQLLIDDRFECYTLEDRVRPRKIAGETAIPPGRYEVVINMSNRFNKRMPLLLAVPEFEGVRIHNGNTKDHTEGCILVGASRSTDFIGNSIATFKAMMPKLEAAAKTEKIFIEIVNEGAPLAAERGVRGMSPAAHKRAPTAARRAAGQQAAKRAPKTAAAKKAAAKPAAKKAAAKKAAAKNAVPKKAAPRTSAPKKPTPKRAPAKTKAASRKAAPKATPATRRSAIRRR